MKPIYQIIFAFGVMLAFGFIAQATGGSFITGVLIFMFAFLLFSVGDNYQRRVAAERFAAREAERATSFMLQRARVVNRLQWYRHSSRSRVSALMEIIRIQDSIAEIIESNGKISAFKIGGILYLPQPEGTPAPNRKVENDDEFFDRNNII